MKVSKSLTAFVNRTFLLLSGLIAAAIAATIWIAPDAFYASYGIALGGDVNLINELKAPAGILFRRHAQRQPGDCGCCRTLYRFDRPDRPVSLPE